jgi:hypothetical protein
MEHASEPSESILSERSLSVTVVESIIQGSEIPTWRVEVKKTVTENGVTNTETRVRDEDYSLLQGIIKRAMHEMFQLTGFRERCHDLDEKRPSS